MNVLRNQTDLELSASQGSEDGFTEMMSFVKNNDLADDANLETLRTMCDVENYLEYVILQSYTGGRDLGNLRVYMEPEDGRWHWVLYDLDLSCIRQDTFDQWLSTSGKVGIITKQDNTLFVKLMQNSWARDWFLTRYGELLADGLSTDSVLTDIDTLYDALKDEMELNCKRWKWKYSDWEKKVESIRTYFKKRPGVMIESLTDCFDLSESEKTKYFGAALDLISDEEA